MLQVQDKFAGVELEDTDDMTIWWSNSHINFKRGGYLIQFAPVEGWSDCEKSVTIDGKRIADLSFTRGKRHVIFTTFTLGTRSGTYGPYRSVTSMLDNIIILATGYGLI